jgi:hypothetical protein
VVMWYGNEEKMEEEKVVKRMYVDGEGGWW